MGVLANHVPSIEQLKPGLVEVLEEGGASKKFFRMSDNRFDLGLGVHARFGRSWSRVWDDIGLTHCVSAI